MDNDLRILTPEAFERYVVEVLKAEGIELDGFEVCHLSRLAGADGDYELDGIVRFTALGVKFTVVIECKHHSYPIKRDVVQVLNQKLQSIGAQKGIIFSTSAFQNGAIKFAKQHGIALIQVMSRTEMVRVAPLVLRVTGNSVLQRFTTVLVTTTENKQFSLIASGSDFLRSTSLKDYLLAHHVEATEESDD